MVECVVVEVELVELDVPVLVVDDAVGEGVAVGVDDGGSGGDGQLASAGLNGVADGVGDGDADADVDGDAVTATYGV